MGQLGEVLMINTSLKLIETDVEEIVQSENYERIQMYMESNKWISQGVSLDYEQIPVHTYIYIYIYIVRYPEHSKIEDGRDCKQ